MWRTWGAGGDLELMAAPYLHAPLHGVGSPRHRFLTPGSTPASPPAGQEWPIATSSCRYEVRGSQGFGEKRAGGTRALVLLGEHVLFFAAPFLMGGPEPSLGHRGGLGEDEARQDQPESSPRAPCREAEPHLGACKTPGNCQTRLQRLGTQLCSPNPTKGNRSLPSAPRPGEPREQRGADGGRGLRCHVQL